MSKCFSWFTLSCLIATGGLGLFACESSQADDQPAKKAAEAPAAEAKAVAKPDRATLEKELTQQLSGCVFVGKFTVVGKEDQAPKEERYTITKVKKQDNGKWIFVARIQYGKHDVQVPMELDIEWAGDTPVITLTDLAIPQLGTFSARVLIHKGWYAGTWLHGEVGGHLFGKIEKLPAEKKSEAKKDTESVKKEEK